MISNKVTPIKIINEKNQNQVIGFQNMKEKLNILQKQYSYINELIASNLKTFDEIVTQDRDTYQTIKRNLQNIKTIFTTDLDKFQQNVDKAIIYNEALYGRLQKDAYYLRDDQQMLRQKMQSMEKRITDMEEQIGVDN